MSPDPVLVTLVILSTIRLTGLWLDDEVTRPVRDRVLTYLSEWRDGDGSPFANWLLTLLTCVWCVSVWFGVAIAAVAYYGRDNPVVVIVLMGLSASQVTGMWGSVGRE